MFHHALWSVASLKEPLVDHLLLGRINIFGDHFHPIVFVLSLPMAIFQRNEVVFITMALSLGIGAYFNLLTGFKLVKSRVIIYALLFAYFLYLGIQNAFIFGFHELNLVPLFFPMMLYAYFYEKKSLYWISFILLLLTKEALIGLFIGWGLFLLMTGKKSRKLGLIAIVLPILYFILVTNIVIPHFSGTFVHGNVSLPHSPSELLTRLTTPQEKISTFWVSMTTFCFLPLLNPFTLPLVLQDILTRYLSGVYSNVLYTLTFHYGLGLAPLLFFSSLWSIKRIEEKYKNKLILLIFSLVIIFSTVYFHLFWQGRGPLQLVFIPDFYKITTDNSSVWEFIQHVPKDGKIVTQNHLGLPLSDRDVYQFPQTIEGLIKLNPDYIIYDNGEDQSPANYIPLQPKEKFFAMMDEIYKTGRYRVYFNQNHLYILKRVLF